MDTSYNYSTTGSGDPAALFMALMIFTIVITLIFVIPALIGMWKVFVKAGKPGWAAIVPLYNLYIYVQIAQKPTWWFVLMLVPYVNIVVNIMLTLEIAKKFNKSAAFAIFGLLLFPFVGWPMLGFGPAQYHPDAVAPNPTPAPQAT